MMDIIISRYATNHELDNKNKTFIYAPYKNGVADLGEDGNLTLKRAGMMNLVSKGDRKNNKRI